MQPTSQKRISGPSSSLPMAMTVLVGMTLVTWCGIWAYLKTRPQFAQVTRRNLAAYVRLEGEAIAPPGERTDMFSPYRAPVARVHTTLGARVRAGEVMVELSHPSAEAYLNRARESLRRAEADYANARRHFGHGVLIADQRLRSARAAERAARRQKTMVEPSLESDDAPPVTVQVATGDVEGTFQQRMSAERELADARSDLNATLLPYQRQLEYARQEVRAAQAGRRISQIRTPITGTVLALNARAGQMVGEDAEKPVATVVNLEGLELHAQATHDQLSRLAPKTPVHLTFSDLPNRYLDGAIRRLTTDVVAHAGGIMKQQQYVAIVRFQNADGLVKPGMKSQIAVKVGEATGVRAVPNEAVGKDQNGRPLVHALRNGRWVPVTVDAGLTDGRYTEIKSGLQLGETVQVTPTLTSS